MTNERGFTLVEMMCAMLVLSLTLLIFAGLSQAAQTEERNAALRLAISREAVTVMENWRMQTTLTPSTATHVLSMQNVAVTETQTVAAQAGLKCLTLSYIWQEGGRSYAQTWATLHP